MKIKSFIIPKWYFSKLSILLLILLIISFFSFTKGAVELSLQDFIDYFSNNLVEEKKIIIDDIRIPRTIIALITGAGLAIAGMILQAVFRNPIVDPFITGVSGGASLGAGIAIIFGFNFSFWGISSIPILSFILSIMCVFISYKISISYGRINIERLMLSGFAISSLCSAILSCLLVIKGEDANYILAWLIGNISGKSWESIQIVLPYFLISNIICIIYINKLNIIQLGDETSENLGFNSNNLKILFIVLSAILSASIVSITGIIGFVGMIVPQICRYLIKTSDYRLMYPFVFIMGALLLIFSDILSRIIIPPQEIPIGVFTSFLGVPFFIFLLLKNKK